jgi:hypothetical protein
LKSATFANFLAPNDELNKRLFSRRCASPSFHTAKTQLGHRVCIAAASQVDSYRRKLESYGDFSRRPNVEDAMPTIIGHHNITKGAKHWLTSPKRKELFGPLGATNIRTFVDPQNPSRVAVLMDVPDMDAFKAAMQTKAAADAMASDGVVPESLVVLVES